MAATTAVNPLRQLADYGQSFWIDTISREMIHSGFLKKLIKEDGLRGVTSNPDIFQKAISGSKLYDDQLVKLARAGKSSEEIYEGLAVSDIRKAADLLCPVYDQTEGLDGYISLEVSPYLAFGTKDTIEEARWLWAAVDRPNVLIKVPATLPSIPAIEELIAEGINVNVTLLFSLEVYARVREAYLKGLERRMAGGHALSTPVSVASFFLSRIDVLVDRLLGNRAAVGNHDERARAGDLIGKTAVACAKLAYQEFRCTFASERFERLRAKGARVQRPLWASTSTKNPIYPDTMYVEPLIGRDTVNTMPLQTIDAWRDHGVVRANSVEEDLEAARQTIEDLKTLGIDLENATWQIQEEGVAKFTEPFDKLLASISSKRLAVLGWDQARAESLGSHAKQADAVAQALSEVGFVARLWKKDASLWAHSGSETARKIENRLGWLNVPSEMRQQADEVVRFAQEIRKAGFRHVVLLGMGGSSLCPEVCARTFGSAQGFPQLVVLDTTSPDAIRAAEAKLDLPKTLFISASKSGTTIETNSLSAYFLGRLARAGVESPSSNFIAIGDPGTSGVTSARQQGFRRVFENPADIGGRYSALSYFGLVPMALIGIDIRKMLDRVLAFSADGGSILPVSADPSVRLGAVFGALAKAGRDKLTLVLSPRIASLGYWLEQLIAESTGKQGVGILPVEGEKLAGPASYGKDRLFVSIELEGDASNEAKLTALEKAGAPVVRIRLNDVIDLGVEFMRWEIATATAGAVLRINPFDEPNVSESKKNTSDLLAEYRSGGSLPVPAEDLRAGGLSFTFSTAAKAAMARKGKSAAAAMAEFAKLAHPGEYLAVLAYVHQNQRNSGRLGAMRNSLRDLTQCATTLGFGPRYLHSTGQLHKGGPNSGVFIVITADPAKDVDIPESDFSFGTLIHAQALGDFRSLDAHGRRAVLVHLGPDVDEGLVKLSDLFAKR